MDERVEKVQLFHDLIGKIPISIPKNTSTSYYLSAMEKMIQDNCDTTFDNNKVTVFGNEEGLLDNIIDISIMIENKNELLFDVNSKKRGTDIVINNHIRVLTDKDGMLSEIEELSFDYDDEFYRYNYIRKYESDGTCFYHSSKDLTRKTSSVAKMFEKGIMISTFYVNDNLRKTILIPIDYNAEIKNKISDDMKKGRIFERINSKEGKEIPYKPYPFNTNKDFEIALNS